MVWPIVFVPFFNAAPSTQASFPILQQLSSLLSQECGTHCCLFWVSSFSGASHDCLLTRQVSVKHDLLERCLFLRLESPHHTRTHTKSFSIIILFCPERHLCRPSIILITKLYIIYFSGVWYKLCEGRSICSIHRTQNRPWHKRASQ